MQNSKKDYHKKYFYVFAECIPLVEYNFPENFYKYYNKREHFCYGLDYEYCDDII